MYYKVDNNKDYIYDASTNLENIINKQIDVENNQAEYDGTLTIDRKRFTIVAKSEVRFSNKGLILNKIDQLQAKTSHPVILIAKYISTGMAQRLKESGYNYLDIAGNCHLSTKNLFIHISGQKVRKISKTHQSRAFQEAGIKLIFNLLQNPINLELSYRKLAELTDISIGSVSNIMNELEELNFLIRSKKKRKLKNTDELLNHWIIAYNDVLRPRLIKKRMRFSSPESFDKWKNLILQDNEDINLWGGEAAAAILTGKLQPLKFTIYTNGTWQNIARKYKFIPDDEGEIEILQMFWNEKSQQKENPIVPTLLIYTELINSEYSRNREIAQILENELQYIKS